MVDLYCASYPRPPAAVTLDIDDTVDVRLAPVRNRGRFPGSKVALRTVA